MFLGWLIAIVWLASGMPAAAADDVTNLLRRQTQELFDAIPVGAASVWEHYLDANARYTDESGTVFNKAQMVEQTKPMPEGVSGRIALVDFRVALHESVAVATYLIDENEDFHGHKLHCKYRTTDTWLKTPKGWRLIASQVLAVRTDPPSVPLTSLLREEYCGRYALTPAITYEIRCGGDALEGQQTGRKPEPLKAEAPDVLFVPGKPRYRKIFQRGPEGRITGFAERREAWDLVWSRLP